MHVSCYQHYIAALKKEASLNPDEILEENIPVAGMDFDCPVCRQSSNLLMLNYDTIPMKHNFTSFEKNSENSKNEIPETVQVEEIYELIKSPNSVFYQKFNPSESSSERVDLELLHNQLLNYRVIL